MSDGNRFLTIPRSDPINAYTMGGIVTDAGLDVEEFKKLLQAPPWLSEYPNRMG